MIGLYVQLDAEYQSDPKIMRAGALAEIVYVRSLGLAKRLLSDGEIDDVQLPLLCMGVPGEPEDHAAKLVNHGLWEEAGTGWHIVAWEKWNKTSEQIQADKQRKVEGGRRGNHQRWHVEKGKVDPSCEFCESDQFRGSESKPVGTAIAKGLRSHEFYLEALRGKDIACWCPLDQPCHADVLLELANR